VTQQQVPYDLSGRLVAVTGAGRGLGRSIALAAADHGADVALTYYDSRQGALEVVDIIRAMGRKANAYECDVTDRDQIFAFVRAAESDLSTIDCLVNNAGIMPDSPFLDLTPQDWESVLATDLTSAFHACQAVLPGMLTKGAGNIVSISSRLGLVGWPGVAHYSAAKAGLIALMKSISREFGQRGIRANTVAPGVINTDMGRTVMHGEVGRKRMAELPLGRFGEPSEVADAVMFLLSERSALFLGQTLSPNSGGLMP
jgi:3-oxoacyl-[acyl-carrier protein] reductase